ncbi:MAG: AAA family ATPase [Thalassotalea sp.]|nr:AAA family ATPase [Thalassotalea sp.]
MYTAYFGLSEAPFSIAPDPAYLFMSDRHREALAHLSYGLGGSSFEKNGGFVLLTGEVGTGKTTISRTVMEKLPENTQASFILNPTLSCEELLACICDNLKIRYKKTGATLKYLTDKIQTKLLKNHNENINTLLIIDEAQHLKPEVLEQLRLLTNLETNTKKLLQVILIGQPELQQLLQRRDLRQLAQRITARYHLLPLTKLELNQYIQHRLSVAQCTRPLFNKAAISALHKISKGIPRVINLLCDRALIIAYGKNDTVIGRKIIQQAAVEALGDVEIRTPFWQIPAKIAAISLLVCGTGYLGYWFAGESIRESESQLVESKDQKAANEPKDALNNLDVKSKPLMDQESVHQAANVQTGMIQTNKLEQNLPQQATKNIQSPEIALPQQPKNVAETKPRVLGYQPEKVNLSGDSNVLESESFDIVAEEGVSDDILTRFKEAINETKPNQNVSNEIGETNIDEATTRNGFDDTLVNNSDEEITENSQQYRAVHQMPVHIQDSLPTLQFEMHIYATEGEGWVRVNGQDRREGEQIAQGVVLTKIFPQQVLLSYQQEQFTMPALSSW